MFRFIYETGIRLYSLLMRLASLFHPKARLFVLGRTTVFEHLDHWKERQSGSAKIVWFHCASLGEFEQGRPVIEGLRKKAPEVRIVLTFFSPSGFEVRKGYTGVDLVLYLPVDTNQNARRFVESLGPDLAVFVKYEYWANYFFALQRRDIPLIVISGIFRENQRFFGWQKSFWTQVLGCVTHFFVQNDHSVTLLSGLGFSNVTRSGDTRFDRVTDIARAGAELPAAAVFRGNGPVLIAGSSYEAEEEVIRTLLRTGPPEVKYIIVPHEPGEAHVNRLIRLFGRSAVKWSEIKEGPSEARVLIVDQIGLLSALYRYADVAIVGGGFGKGIHNVIEAAVYGIPVVFGPNYQKFAEAVGLVGCGGGFAVDDGDAMRERAEMLLTSFEEARQRGVKSRDFVSQGVGGVEIILESAFKLLNLSQLKK